MFLLDLFQPWHNTGGILVHCLLRPQCLVVLADTTSSSEAKELPAKAIFQVWERNKVRRSPIR